jgi:hypothetical protein
MDEMTEGQIVFDPEALAVLGVELREAAQQAQAVCLAVGALERRACELGAPSPAPEGLFGDTRLLLFGPPAVRGLRQVADEAPELADTIARRMAHFAAAESAVRLGYRIDPHLWFTDATPFRLDRVDGAIAAIDARFADFDLIRLDDYPYLRRTLEALTLAERQAVLGGIAPATITNIGQDLGRRRWRGGRGNPRTIPLDPDDERELLGLLLTAAPASLVPLLSAEIPTVEPAFGEVSTFGRRQFGDRAWSDGLRYADSGAPLIDGGISTDDVRQRALGDCWFVAGLLAVARANPRLIGENIRDNGNGTVTVTFYRDAAPVPVTVTTGLPFAPRVGWHPFAVDGLSERITETWGPLYEKAFAQLHGGYSEIENGDVDEALGQLTGRPSHRSCPDDVTVEQLRELLSSGHAVTASTSFEILGLFGTDPGPLETRHVYAVTGVGPDGTVTLRDPRFAGEGSLIRLPWSTLRRHLDAVAWVAAR